MPGTDFHVAQARDAQDVGRGRDGEERRRLKAALDPVELEAGLADRRLGVARRPAAAERPRPEERVDGVLHRPERCVRRPDVLVHAKLAAGGEDAPDLPERVGRVRDAAQHPDGDDGVVRAVRGRQPLGEPLGDLDRHRSLHRPLSGRDTGRRVGLDRQHGLDLRPVVLERTPLAAADLDHPPAEPTQEPPPKRRGALVGVALLTPLEQPREPRLPGAVERRQALSLSVGNRITSRIERTPVSAIRSRSMPMPTPTVGGIPYSSAST